MAKKIKEEIHLKKRVKPLPVRYTPNVTPLIDVMFLLLLFFLLTTKFRVEEGAIPGTLPALGKSYGNPENTSDLPPAITLSVNPAGTGNESACYEIGGMQARVVSPEDLFTSLRGKAKQYDDKEVEKVPVIIKARSDVRWGFVVEAFNQAARARFKSIAFAPVGS